MYNKQGTAEGTHEQQHAAQKNRIIPGYTLEPAISKFQEKYYSLEPDMANGWRPNRRVFRQFPLRFSYRPADLVVTEYTKFGEQQQYRVLYLGPRYSSNLKALKAYCWKEYEPFVKESFLYDTAKLNRFEFSYNKDKEKGFIARSVEHRIFTGMNPTVDSGELLFDSDFQCGNLDVVMKVAPNEYDLLMRVDSNTRGHNSWFFFKVKNTQAQQTVKFNICNFHKLNSLYTSGLKPYFFSRASSKQWRQLPGPVDYSRKLLRFEGTDEIKRPLACLSFSYSFDNAYDEVYFAYSIPYSYSFLLSTINSLADKSAAKGFFSVSYNLQSSAGLPIPLITLTNPEEAQSTKKVVLITARQHPGQAQGSWMMHGLLEYLCSDEAKQLRSRAIFKILPMLNVDGVVLGNFRTGALGLDLNRLFREEESDQFYEIEYVKELASAKSNIFYLDLHGHSNRKSVFIYGPDYKLSDSEYIISRLLPKQISRLTEMFRYYSCSFKISKGKEKTARASLLRDYGIPYCYTVEASTHSFTSAEGEFLFTSHLYSSMGQNIGKALDLVVPIVVGVEKRKQVLKERLARAKERKLERTQVVSLPRMSKRGRSMSNKKASCVDATMNLSSEKEAWYYTTEICIDLFEEIKQQDKSMFETATEGDSDCEDLSDDYSKQQRQLMFEGSDLVKPGTRKNSKHSNSPFIKPRLRKSQLADEAIKRRLNESSIEGKPESNHPRREQYLQARRKSKNQTSNKLEPSAIAKNSSSKAEESPINFRSEFKEMRRNRQLERAFQQSQMLIESQPQQTKIHTINLQAEMDGASPGMQKMATIQSRHSEADGLDEHGSRSKIIPKFVTIHRPIELGDDLLEYSRRQHNSLCYARLPDISRKDLVPRKKRIELLNCKAQVQIPEVISDILKRHTRMAGLNAEERQLNRSIQIVKL